MWHLKRWHLALGVCGLAAGLIWYLCQIYGFFHPKDQGSKELPMGWTFAARWDANGFLVELTPIPFYWFQKQGIPDWFYEDQRAKRWAQPILPVDPPASVVPERVPLPKPKPDMWEKNYLAWVARRSSTVGDGEGPKFTKEWRSCEVSKPHPICKEPLSFRKKEENYPIELKALRDK